MLKIDACNDCFKVLVLFYFECTDVCTVAPM